MSAKTLESLFKSNGTSKSTAKPTQTVPSTYISLEAAAQALDLSIYRTRQLQWEGKLKSAKKFDKMVYFERKEVEALKNEREHKDTSRDQLNRRRIGKRVKFSVEVVKTLINSDEVLTNEQKQAVSARFDYYLTEAQKLLQK